MWPDQLCLQCVLQECAPWEYRSWEMGCSSSKLCVYSPCDTSRVITVLIFFYLRFFYFSPSVVMEFLQLLQQREECQHRTFFLFCKQKIIKAAVTCSALTVLFTSRSVSSRILNISGETDHTPLSS